MLEDDRSLRGGQEPGAAAGGGRRRPAGPQRRRRAGGRSDGRAEVPLRRPGVAAGARGAGRRRHRGDARVRIASDEPAGVPAGARALLRGRSLGEAHRPSRGGGLPQRVPRLPGAVQLGVLRLPHGGRPPAQPRGDARSAGRLQPPQRQRLLPLRRRLPPLPEHSRQVLQRPDPRRVGADPGQDGAGRHAPGHGKPQGRLPRGRRHPGPELGPVGDLRVPRRVGPVLHRGPGPQHLAVDQRRERAGGRLQPLQQRRLAVELVVAAGEARRADAPHAPDPLPRDLVRRQPARLPLRGQNQRDRPVA